MPLLKSKEKVEFINQYMESMKKMLLNNVAKMPEEWDGHELRQYIADKFAWEATNVMRDDRKRRRAYKNEVLVRNL